MPPVLGPEHGERPDWLMQLTTEALLAAAEAWWEEPAMLYFIWREAMERRSIAARTMAQLIGLHLRANDSFVWPGTDAAPGTVPMPDTDWKPMSPLRALGYHVGRSAPAAAERRRILGGAFTHPLPPVIPADELAEWSKPSACARLHKMANLLSSLAKNAKRKDSRALGLSIEHWESDLEWLRQMYHAGRCDFVWPSSR